MRSPWTSFSAHFVDDFSHGVGSGGGRSAGRWVWSNSARCANRPNTSTPIRRDEGSSRSAPTASAAAEEPPRATSSAKICAIFSTCATSASRWNRSPQARSWRKACTAVRSPRARCTAPRGRSNASPCQCSERRSVQMAVTLSAGAVTRRSALARSGKAPTALVRRLISPRVSAHQKPRDSGRAAGGLMSGRKLAEAGGRL